MSIDGYDVSVGELAGGGSRPLLLVLMTLRIGGGQGFWGDWEEAPVRLIEDGPLDFLVLDYLSEVTMSILQKEKEASRYYPVNNPVNIFRSLLGRSSQRSVATHELRGHSRTAPVQTTALQRMMDYLAEVTPHLKTTARSQL